MNQTKENRNRKIPDTELGTEFDMKVLPFVFTSFIKEEETIAIRELTKKSVFTMDPPLYPSVASKKQVPNFPWEEGLSEKENSKELGEKDRDSEDNDKDKDGSEERILNSNDKDVTPLPLISSPGNQGGDNRLKKQLIASFSY